MVSSCSTEDQAVLQKEALSLTSEEVPAWLKKHSVKVPSDFSADVGVEAFVLEVITYAQEGVDASVYSYKPTVDFVHEIQAAAGYSFNP